jgi:hypothetical protein
MTGPPRWALCTLLVGLAGCGTAPLPAGAPAPAPGVDLPRWIHALPARAGDELWVRNDSDGYVHLVSVTLRDCMNVDGPCGVRSLETTLCPGDARRVATVTPLERNAAWHFNWDLEAERYASLTDRIGMRCEP